ncbi:MAG: DivIVA domain-containing protein [Clostridia bacterium]|nr:DivIVA domain-containing protein [Clostridia bacterium]
MLKPEAIRNKEFEQSVLGGYRRDEVDAFLDEVEADYQKLYNDNADLVEKLKACVSKIEVYQKDEEFLKTAIINAQRLNETTLKEIELREKEVEVASKEKAAAIISEAEAKAAEILKNAEIESADAIRAAREKCRAEIESEQKKSAEAIATIHADTEAEQNKLDYLRGQVSEFKNTIIELYKAHLTSISKLPEFKAEAAPAEPAKEEVVEPEKQVVKEEPIVEEPVVEEKVEEIVEEPVKSENTVEFKISEKAEKKEAEKDENRYSAKQIRFENLKFGVDYDINKDE